MKEIRCLVILYALGALMTVLIWAACDPGTSEKSIAGGGPDLRCDYYPQYDVSVLWLGEFSGYRAGMTGAFYDGNRCLEGYDDGRRPAP